jgi:serine/threonine protein kinase
MDYQKGKLLVEGGEGYIYEVADNPSLLMKVYKEKDLSGAPIITRELQSKLEYMKNNPPEALVSKGIVAWPVELINEGSGNLFGFIMPRMDFDEHIQRTYSYRHPTLEAEEYKRFPSVESRIKIAMNLCSALNELHIKKYVFGDLNHHNVGVNYKTGQICFMDCDSLHITTDGGSVFRTGVIMAGYLAPEIIRHCNNERSNGRGYNLDDVLLPTFTKESDLFCLSVHIFKLLMNGVNPFLGVKTDATGSTASPFVGNEAIERNSYVFREGNKPSAVFCLPAESLPFELSTLLHRAFLDGAKVSYLRPSAADWYNALNRYLTSGLVQCPREFKHQYYNQLSECPYCIADDRHLAAQQGLPVLAFAGEPVSLPVLPVTQTAVQQSPIAQPTTVQHPSVQPQPTVQSPRPRAVSNVNSSPAIIAEIKKGETRNLEFGKYRWRVLDKQKDKALLLMENIVELRPYNSKSGATTWEKCSLREYLNTAFARAFSNEEFKIIIESRIKNTKNLWTGVKCGYDTDDNFFLLSLDEIDSYLDKSGYYRNKVIERIHRITNNCDKDRATVEPWWLRTPGKSVADAAFITSDGHIYVGGNPVNSYDIGVRPAMWIALT